MGKVQQQRVRWVTSRSALDWGFKKLKGFEEWFYTGPSLHFGHPNANKKKGKKG